MEKDKLIRTLNEYSVDGYESPIHMVTNDIRLKVENKIAKAVLDVGIDVNKEELLKALRYDREQYDKGYRDGINEQRWIPVSERLPGNYIDVLVQWQMKNRINNTIEVFLHTGFINEYGEWIHADGLGAFNGEIIAWMPLPEPYKTGDSE